MAKYLVTYQCGHASDEQLYGKTDDRYAHIERQRGRLCSECYRAQQTAEATEQAEAAGLPTLTGSGKQVAWAETIRAKLLTEIARQRAEFEALGRRKGATEDNIAAALAQFDGVVAKVVAQTGARWWIDNRDQGPVAIMRAAR